MCGLILLIKQKFLAPGPNTPDQNKNHLKKNIFCNFSFRKETKIINW